MGSNGFVKMPPEVLDMIFKPLSLSDKKNVRAVCHQFREVIDEQLRFKVVLNNKSAAAVGKISRRKGIETLIIESFNKTMKTVSSTRFVLANKRVAELVLAGRSGYLEERVKPMEQPNHYPYVGQETHVHRCFDHWMSLSNLHIGMGEVNLRYSLRSINDTVSTLIVSSDIFTELTTFRAFSSPEALLPNLESLEMTLVHHLPYIRKRVNAGIGTMFDCRFPCLKKLKFMSLCGCTAVTDDQWVKFYKFVGAHGRTLEELIVKHHFHFNILDYNEGIPDPDSEIQETLDGLRNLALKRLTLIILNNTNIFRCEKEIYRNSFELELLANQTKLQILKLDFGYLFVDRVFEMLPKCENLEACSIHAYCTRLESQTINLGFVKDSKQLKFLQIVCEQDVTSAVSPWKLIGVKNLPSSIERLSLSSELTVGDARWVEDNLINLVEISYCRGVRRSMNNTQLSPAAIEYSTFAHFSECVKKLPKLTTFRLATDNFLIKSNMNNLRRNFNFSVSRPFSNYQLPYNEQH